MLIWGDSAHCLPSTNSVSCVKWRELKLGIVILPTRVLFMKLLRIASKLDTAKLMMPIKYYHFQHVIVLRLYIVVINWKFKFSLQFDLSLFIQRIDTVWFFIFINFIFSLILRTNTFVSSISGFYSYSLIVGEWTIQKCEHIFSVPRLPQKY